MKYAFLALLTLTVQAAELPGKEPVPDYMVGATITVTTRDGRKHSFSGEEHKVVKRKSLVFDQPEDRVVIKKAEPKRNIISGEVLQSQSAEQKVTQSGNSVTVETQRKIGAGVQYQRLVDDDIYLGGRIDTNGGVGFSLGVGF